MGSSPIRPTKIFAAAGGFSAEMASPGFNLTGRGTFD
jgi:hypothetical protein